MDKGARAVDDGIRKATSPMSRLGFACTAALLLGSFGGPFGIEACLQPCKQSAPLASALPQLRGSTLGPAMRLRGGQVDPEVGDFAGDISYGNDDSADGIDPYNHDGPLPDSFPSNPESMASRDESPPITIDAEQHMRRAKEGMLFLILCLGIAAAMPPSRHHHPACLEAPR